MATIFILPKDQECNDKSIRADVLTNPNIKILFPDNLLINEFNGGLNKTQSAINILAKINAIQPNGERYLLYHIGNMVDISTALKTLDEKLFVRLYAGHGDAAELKEHKKIIDLIESVLDNTANQNIDELVKIFFYDKELEAKLELLHNCLAFAKAPDLDPLLSAKHQKHYTDFLAAMKDKVTDGTNREHINALTELRKALLGS